MRTIIKLIFLLYVVGNNGVQYGQNIGIPFTTPPLNHHHESNSVNTNEKALKFHTKVERDREEGIYCTILLDVFFINTKIYF